MTPQQQQAAAAAAVYAQQQAIAGLRERLLAYLAALFRRPGAWHTADAAGFVRHAVPTVAAAQRQTAALTAAYLRQYVSLFGGRVDLGAYQPDKVTGEATRGVDPAEVYQRPYRSVWMALGDGKPLDEAVQAGEDRLTSIAATDVQLAKTRTAQAVLSHAERVVGYRRVPEGAQTCGLCLIAATQRYHSGELLPIHSGCDCGVEPIVGTRDPGRTIDEAGLAAVHRAIADRIGKSAADGRQVDYRKYLIVHQHGEIGPVLAVRGQAFTSEADLPHH